MFLRTRDKRDIRASFLHYCKPPQILTQSSHCCIAVRTAYLVTVDVNIVQALASTFIVCTQIVSQNNLKPASLLQPNLEREGYN